MKKLFYLLAFLPALAFGQAIIQDGAKLGSFTASSCTVDSDVDTAFSTTVRADSASGQTNLHVTASTNLVAGDTVLVDADNSGNRREVCVIASCGAGPTCVCSANLTYTHTAAQADDIVLTNRVGPLTVGDAYAIALTTTAHAPQTGAFVMGDEFVSVAASQFATLPFPASLGTQVMQVKAAYGATYISVRTEAANAVFRACKLR